MAHDSRQEAIIETLHDLQLAHIEEFTQDEAEDLRIGDPRPEASDASERLVRIRGLLHTLDVDGEPSRKLPRETVRQRLDEQLDTIEGEVEAARKRRDETERELNRVEDRIERLKPFRQLPLAFEDYHGYDTLEVFVGEGLEELGAQLDAELDRYDHFQGEELDAVFVHVDEADRARDLLVREGFRNVDVPGEEGAPDAELQQAREIGRAHV